MTESPIVYRMRRRRLQPSMRALLRETHISVDDLILPIFLHHDASAQHPIDALPGHFQWGIEQLPLLIQRISALGIKALLLFGIPANKDAQGSESWHANGVVQQAIPVIKQLAPHLLVMADCCFCQYTDHGHCGELDAQGNVDNDATLQGLAKQAVSLSQAGADVIAPSGMIDGMVAAIRTALDQEDMQQVSILSYAVKYQSAFYGPFREAAQGSPSIGDRASHQMDIGNSHEALRELALDVEEGADWAIIKPAGHYLDVIARLHQRYPEIPLVGYQVSGEYSALIAAIDKGWLSEQVITESLIAIKRAGASAIITYFAEQVASMLSSH